MKQDLMKGVIDMHVHTNPDLRLRAYDDFELMEAAIRVGALRYRHQDASGNHDGSGVSVQPPQRDCTRENEQFYDVWQYYLK